MFAFTAGGSLTPSLVIAYIAFLFANLGLFATYAILFPSLPHDKATLVVAACAYDSPNAGANLPPGFVVAWFIVTTANSYFFAKLIKLFVVFAKIDALSAMSSKS